jgi:hypothetical protein
MIPPLPEQRVPQKTKETLDWQKKCIIALVGRAYSNLSGSRTSREAKQINYDLFNSIVNISINFHINMITKHIHIRIN